MSTSFDWITKLAPLIERDQFIQDALERRGILEDCYHPELEKVQKENALKFKALVEHHGFPVLSSAGEKGVQLAWMIIHHSISLPDFMKECLTQMRLAAAADDFPKDLLAFTEDRISYLEGRAQLYGTHFDWQGGELRPTPIEDADHVDFRRKAYGLPPLAETLFKVVHAPPPKDPKKKSRDFQEWLKKVGWRI